jgi:septal ring factor EnvC (AmiA/AmiB activator)
MNAETEQLEKIAQEYLRLKTKLAQDSSESDYFRWALKSNKTKLQQLKTTYESARLHYTSATLQTLQIELEMLEKEKEIIQQRKNSFSRAVILNNLSKRMERISHYILLKKNKIELPEL